MWCRWRFRAQHPPSIGSILCSSTSKIRFYWSHFLYLLKRTKSVKLHLFFYLNISLEKREKMTVHVHWIISFYICRFLSFSNPSWKINLKILVLGCKVRHYYEINWMRWIEINNGKFNLSEYFTSFWKGRSDIICLTRNSLCNSCLMRKIRRIIFNSRSHYIRYWTIIIKKWILGRQLELIGHEFHHDKC